MKLLYGLTENQMRKVHNEVEIGDFEEALNMFIKDEEGLYDGDDEVIITDKLIRAICEYSLDYEKNVDVYTIVKDFFDEEFLNVEFEYKEQMESVYGLETESMVYIANIVNRWMEKHPEDKEKFNYEDVLEELKDEE